MLEKLRAVPWSELAGVFGTGAEVPGLVEAARRCRDGANVDFVTLSQEACHQGRVSQVGARLVPFLIELAQAEDHLRVALLRLLAEIRVGAPLTASDAALGWLREAQAAVEAGVPFYVGLLADPSSKIRGAAAMLLGRCATQREVSVPALVARMQAEPDANTEMSLLHALGRLDVAGHRALFEERLAAPLPLTRLVAAVALARLPDPPAGALTFLREMANDQALDEYLVEYFAEGEELLPSLALGARG